MASRGKPAISSSTAKCREARLREQRRAARGFRRPAARADRGRGARRRRTSSSSTWSRGHGQMRQIRPVGRRRRRLLRGRRRTAIIAGRRPCQREDRMTNNEILLHEYAHHFMLQNLPARLSGLVCRRLRRISDDRPLRRPTRSNAAISIAAGQAGWPTGAGWLPLERLLFGDRRRLDGPRSPNIMRRAGSWSIISSAIRSAGAAVGLSRLPSSAATAPRRRSQTAFDMTPAADAARAAAAYGRRRHHLSQRRPGPAPAARRRHGHVDAARRPTTCCSPDAAMTQRAITAEARTASCARVRRAAARPRRPLRAARAAPWPKPITAMAPWPTGCSTRCSRESPDDAELLYLKGMRYLRRRLSATSPTAPPTTGARSPCSAARTAPTRTIIRRSTAMPKASRASRASSAKTPATSCCWPTRLAPQVDEITLSAAHHLLRRGEFDQAEALLAPLAANPHRGRVIQTAILLHGKAGARDNRDLPAVFVRAAARRTRTIAARRRRLPSAAPSRLGGANDRRGFAMAEPRTLPFDWADPFALDAQLSRRGAHGPRHGGGLSRRRNCCRA